MELDFETISSLRNARQGLNIPVSIKMNIEIMAEKDEKPIFEAVLSYIKRLARVEEIKFVDEKSKTQTSTASCVVGNSKIFIPLEGLIDLEAEKARQNRKLEKLLVEKKSLEGRINNQNFVKNAPSEVIEQTKARIDEINVLAGAIEDLIKSL